MPKRKPAHGGTPAIVELDRLALPYVLRAYNHDPDSDLNFGLEAAQSLGAEPDQVFKTLMALADGELVVGVVPVSSHLDLKAFAAALGAKKATMASVEDAERATGYVAGGISPIGQKKKHRTVIDESAQLFDSVFVSGGRRGLDIEMAPENLARAADASFAPIAKE